MNILVVEHAEVLSEFLCRYLRTRSHLVQVSDNLQSAREALASARFDVLITDVRLPDGDGTTLIDEALPGLPRFSITMSAYDADELRISAPTTGARRHLHKPFATEELAAALRCFASDLQRSG